MTPRPEVLFVGGRAGSGKTTVAAEVHAQLSTAGVRHFVVEGDTLDLAWPVPWQDGLHLAEANLAAMWATYTGAGHGRMVYTNTASVRPEVLGSLLAAIGGDPVVHGVLLTATEATAAARLGAREIGSALQEHLASSRRNAVELERAAPAWVRRVSTDDRSVTDIAREIVSVLGWEPLPEDGAGSGGGDGGGVRSYAGRGVVLQGVEDVVDGPVGEQPGSEQVAEQLCAADGGELRRGLPDGYRQPGHGGRAVTRAEPDW